MEMCSPVCVKPSTLLLTRWVGFGLRRYKDSPSFTKSSHRYSSPFDLTVRQTRTATFPNNQLRIMFTSLQENESDDRYDSGQETIDVEENQSIGGEIDVDKKKDLRTLVNETRRMRGNFVAALSTAALALLSFGALFGISYGVSTVAQRSKNFKTPIEVSFLF